LSQKVTIFKHEITPYIVRNSHLYFKITSYIVPFRTLLSQKSLSKHVITPCIVRFRHLYYLKKGIYCPISDSIVPKVTFFSCDNNVYCPFRPLEISKKTPSLSHFGLYCPKSHLDFFDKVDMVGHYIKLVFRIK
jgi:hypothetical protein